MAISFNRDINSRNQVSRAISFSQPEWLWLHATWATLQPNWQEWVSDWVLVAKHHTVQFFQSYDDEGNDLPKATKPSHPNHYTASVISQCWTAIKKITTPYFQALVVLGSTEFDALPTVQYGQVYCSKNRFTKWGNESQQNPRHCHQLLSIILSYYQLIWMLYLCTGTFWEWMYM